MAKKVSKEAEELSFFVLESILMQKEYKSKEEVMEVITDGLEQVKSGDEHEPILKEAYEEAYNKLNSINFKQMMQIRSIIEEDD